MPLTRDQLSKLEPPSGWVFTSRPTLRTQGTIKFDPAQAVTSRNAPERYQRLEKWARENGFGVRPLVGSSNRIVVSTPYTNHYLTSHFKVSANKPELTERTFNTGPCLCGYLPQLSIGQITAPDCCGVMRCTACRQAGTRLYFVADYGHLCSTCSQLCAEEGCDAAVSAAESGDPKCHKHTTNVKCCMCGVHGDRKAATPLLELSDTFDINMAPYIPIGDPNDPDSYFVCNKCVTTFTCAKCKLFDALGACRRRPTNPCQECVDKEANEKLEAESKFDADELPKGGTLLIPSLPSRPFRTISIETEMDGDGGFLARTLYRCGHVPINRVASYGSHPDVTTQDSIAFLKHDGSVTAGELISFLVNLDDKNHAETFLDLLRRLKGLHKLGKIEYNSNCGGHIHIDAHNFGYGSVWRLLTGFGYAEDPIYRIAGAGAPYGHRTLDPRHDRANNGRGYTHSPVKGPFGSKGEVGRQIQGQDRMCGLNFVPLMQAIRNCQCGAWAYEDSRKCKCNLGKATIEWRVFNSTGNPRILHGWIALVQALHAWADEDVDPTPEWEKKYPALGWTKQPFNKTNDKHQAATKERLEWIHTQLPLTTEERDSLCYAISKSDMGTPLGNDYIESLKELPNVADYDKEKSTRNPARRQRQIVVEPPDPTSKKSDKTLTENPFVLNDFRVAAGGINPPQRPRVRFNPGR